MESDPSASRNYFSKNHEDINISKEEMAFLEKQFLKYVTSEMEKDSSTWKDFYDILKEDNSTVAQDDERPNMSQQHNSSGAQTRKGDNGNGETAGEDFRVNTERTKQQYKDNATFNGHSKWAQNSPPPSQHQTPPPPTSSFNTSKHQHQPKGKTNKYTTSDKNHHDRTEPFDRSQQHSNNRNTARNTTTNKENKPPSRKATRKNKNSKRAPSTAAETSNTSLHEQNANGLNSVMTSDKMSRFKTVFLVIKNVCIIFVCFVLMIAAFLLKALWMLLITGLRISLLVLIYIHCKLMGFWSGMNNKYGVSQKVRHYLGSLVELFTLVTGIHVSRWFSRKKNNEADDDDMLDDLPIVFPSTSEEAIKQLLNQKQSRPYRTLCVPRSASNEMIKGNYRKLAKLVHPDKCEHEDAAEAFKILDVAFKKISDSEKRGAIDEEIDKERAWREFNKNMGEDFKKMFDDIVNSLQCSNCEKRHKKNLVKNRQFHCARYCGSCNTRHQANNGDVWAEENMFGMGWTCYACFDSEVFEVTDWARCQNLKGNIPVNSHVVACRIGNQNDKKGNSGQSRRKNKKARKQRK